MSFDMDYLYLDDDSGPESAGTSSSEDEVQVMLQGTPEQRRRLRRRSLGQASESEDEFEKEMESALDATVKRLETQRAHVDESRMVEGVGEQSTGGSGEASSITPSKVGEKDGPPSSFYNQDYFDSDEEDNSGGAGARRPTDEELLYDPAMDEADERWVENQKRRSRGEGRTGTAPAARGGTRKVRPALRSDAVLSCPACMSTLCNDCQRHTTYKHQYRAMFVMHCKIDDSQVLRVPEEAKQGKKKKKNRKEETVPEMSEGGTEGKFNPVRCSVCNTEVAMYDEEEVYHFYNVLASYG